jgi:C2H2-type zinc finger/Zinc finger, C2H2 type
MECIDTLTRAYKLNEISVESEMQLKHLIPTGSCETIVKEEKIDSDDDNTKFKLEQEDYEMTAEYHVDVKCDEDLIEPEIDINDDVYEESSDEKETLKMKKKKTPPKKHQCPTCLKLFEKPSKLARHVQTHDVNKKPFACEVIGCFQRFLTDASLKRHAILHSGMTIKVHEEKTYECIVCLKEFKVQEALASHMRTHKDVMDQLEFPCPLCNEVFKKLNDLTRHSRKHPENKSHKCLICSKMFSQGSHLIDHLNRHNNLRPHVCHVCNKSFQQSSTLKDHLRTHTSEKRKENKFLRRIEMTFFANSQLSSVASAANPLTIHQIYVNTLNAIST